MIYLKFVKKNWLKLAKKYKLKIIIEGLNALPNFSIKSEKWMHYKSYITYIMLKNSILASNSIYLSTSHKKSVLKKLLPAKEKRNHCISKIKNIPYNFEI